MLVKAPKRAAAQRWRRSALCDAYYDDSARNGQPDFLTRAHVNRPALCTVVEQPPKARLIVLPGVGHVLHHVAPDRMTTAVATFAWIERGGAAAASAATYPP